MKRAVVIVTDYGFLVLSIALLLIAGYTYVSAHQELVESYEVQKNTHCTSYIFQMNPGGAPLDNKYSVNYTKKN